MGIDAERLIYRLMFFIDSFKKFNVPVKNLDAEVSYINSTWKWTWFNYQLYKFWFNIRNNNTNRKVKKAEDESVPRHLNDHINMKKNIIVFS